MADDADAALLLYEMDEETLHWLSDFPGVPLHAGGAGVPSPPPPPRGGAGEGAACGAGGATRDALRDAEQQPRAAARADGAQRDGGGAASYACLLPGCRVPCDRCGVRCVAPRADEG
jgi:hypothetical protein